jgi:3alpha(or 20beta)-hydroxysteroid dehydrogenase
LFIQHDVRLWDQWESVVKQAEKRFGLVNVLINNAGVIGPVQHLKDFSEASFLDVCAVNQLGVFLGMKAVVPSMIAAGGGSIVNVSSIAGLVGLPESPNFAYVASKFAVRGMTKAAAQELGPLGIRVNSVHPGGVLTRMVLEQADTGHDGTRFLGNLPLARFAEPAEISRLVVYLASDDSSYSTGSEFVADGGLLAGPGY